MPPSLHRLSASSIETSSVAFFTSSVVIGYYPFPIWRLQRVMILLRDPVGVRRATTDLPTNSIHSHNLCIYDVPSVVLPVCYVVVLFRQLCRVMHMLEEEQLYMLAPLMCL